MWNVVAIAVIIGCCCWVATAQDDDVTVNETAKTACIRVVSNSCALKMRWMSYEQAQLVYNGSRSFSLRDVCYRGRDLKDCVDNVLNEQCSPQTKYQLLHEESELSVNNIMIPFVCEQHFDEVETIGKCIMAKFKTAPEEVSSDFNECSSTTGQSRCIRKRESGYCMADVSGEMCGSEASTLGRQFFDVYSETFGCPRDSSQELKQRGYAQILKRLLKLNY